MLVVVVDFCVVGIVGCVVDGRWVVVWYMVGGCDVCGGCVWVVVICIVDENRFVMSYGGMWGELVFFGYEWIIDCVENIVDNC